MTQYLGVLTKLYGMICFIQFKFTIKLGGNEMSIEMIEKPKKAYLVQKIDKHGYEYICGIALSSETAQNFVNEKNEESRTKKTGKHFWFQNLNIIE
jgi:hypothetical protein